MEKAEPSDPEVERQRQLIATLLRRIRMLESELEALRRKVVNVWGEA